MLKIESTYVNEKEIAIIGVQRSGNHAIINWLADQFNGNRRFYNSFHQYLANEGFKKKWTKANFQFYNNHLPSLENLNLVGWTNHVVLYNIENQQLDSIQENLMQTKRRFWFGRSKSFYTAIILRDPFNTFASRLKDDMANDYKLRISLLKPNGKIFIDNWKSYAKEALRETNILYPKPIVILYNKWFADIDYRKHLSNQFGGHFSDRYTNTVPSIGNGSSFDGVKYSKRASDMQVLYRWKQMSENEDYRNIFKDTELVELSERLFGHIEGTENIIP